MPPTYIPIIDERGNQRGHVHGLKASEATIARFGVRNAKLKKINGKLTWVGKTTPKCADRMSLSKCERSASLKAA